MSKKEATIIQNFNAEKRKYEYSIKGYDVTKSIEILLKKHKEEYDKERRVFESTKGYLEAQQEYEKHIANIHSQLDQENERLKGAIIPKFKIGQEVFIVNTDYYYKKDYKVEKHKIVGIEDKVDRKNTYVRWYSLEFKDCPANYSKRYKFLEKNVFATETEAEKKLQELRGGE